MADFKPDPKLKFTFGLWTVGNIGRDPFGGPVREQLSPPQIADLLGEVGAYGVNFHDNDLVPIDATAAQRDAIVKEFKKALKNNGLVVPMATTNLFSDPVFKDGAFTLYRFAAAAAGYLPIERSALVPALDFALLARFALRPDTPRALRELEAELRRR